MGHNLARSHFGVDEHPFATYLDVQGYRVLTHSHMLSFSLAEFHGSEMRT